MTDQPGQGRSQENPYATGPGQPSAQRWQPPTALAAGPPQAAPPRQGPPYAAHVGVGYAAGGYAPARPLPPLAHWGKRVGAFLVDQFLMAVPILLGILLWTGSVEYIGTDGDGRPVAGPTAAGDVSLLVCYAIGLGLHIWNRYVRQGRTGRSLGKQLLRIALVSEAGRRPVGVLTSFTRDIAHAVDQVAFVGYLWPLWDAKRQTFADKILGTVVVDG